MSHSPSPADLDVLSEPDLVFRFDQKATDPRDGLSIFGPPDADLPSHPRSISLGVIGTGEGVQLFRDFAERVSRPISSFSEFQKIRLWPPFPGFEEAFLCAWSPKPTGQVTLDSYELDTAARNLDPNKRAYAVVNQYLDGIGRLSKSESHLTAVVCIVPDFVHTNCRPQSKIVGGVGERVSLRTRVLRMQGYRDLEALEEPTAPYRFSVDFRRQIKARAMAFGLPIQIVRQSTLNTDDSQPAFGTRQLTPLSDRAWNVATALFYKSDGKPWRLSTAREGVCYVGVVFRRNLQVRDERSACCAAQMFLDDGDGVVLRGDFGPWYSPETEEFHLTRDAARSLLSRVLETYSSGGGKPLREVFLHYRAEISRNEFLGYSDACPAGVRLVAIRIRRALAGTRLYREGTRPVIRGTMWTVSNRLALLWTSGFKPRLGTYDGQEVPVPLEIRIQYGDADPTQVCRDIFGLTKLNYNECRFGDSEPVTIGFSNAVGEVLVSNPTIKNPSPRFKFYI